MDTTPILAIPYPEGSDPMTDYPGVAQDAAELIEAELLAAIGVQKLWDSIEAGVALPAASITTPALDQTFRDLVIRVLSRKDSASASHLLARFNGDAGATYDIGLTDFSGGTVTGSALNGQTSAYVGRCNGTDAAAGYFAGTFLEILDFSAAATRHKSYRGHAVYDFGSGGGAKTTLYTGLWHPAVLAAISTVTLMPAAGNFVAGTRITVYGRK